MFRSLLFVLHMLYLLRVCECFCKVWLTSLVLCLYRWQMEISCLSHSTDIHVHVWVLFGLQMAPGGLAVLAWYIVDEDNKVSWAKQTHRTPTCMYRDFLSTYRIVSYGTKDTWHQQWRLCYCTRYTGMVLRQIL